ncbi:MAG TPA: hypothetical protein VFH43_12920 [Candidatus Kapabacteria bacterium]|nr:hypothetical protein [Candidatus Kapabacteria bacterium]
MPKFFLLVLTILLSSAAAHAQRKYVHRAAFMCLDGDTCRIKTAVEDRYPESALYVNVTMLDDRVSAITAGKDWSAKEDPVSFYDTTHFLHFIGDTAYFIDANNDKRQDILFSMTSRSGSHFAGSNDKWILLLQNEHGTFTKLSVQQYGSPLWRRNKHNFWLSTRLVDDTVARVRYWVEDLFDLRGEQFVNIGAKYAFPRIREYGGKLPRMTKKLRQLLRKEEPGELTD